MKMDPEQVRLGELRSRVVEARGGNDLRRRCDPTRTRAVAMRATLPTTHLLASVILTAAL